MVIINPNKSQIHRLVSPKEVQMSDRIIIYGKAG